MLIPLLFFVKKLLIPSREKETPVACRGSPPPTTRRPESLKTLLLYERLLQEFDPEERRFFSHLVRECLLERNYPKGEDLFQYCYFSTLKRRLENLWKKQRTPSAMGAYIYSQSLKEVEYSIDYYRKILEKGAISPKGGSSPSFWLEVSLKEMRRPPGGLWPCPSRLKKPDPLTPTFRKKLGRF